MDKQIEEVFEVSKADLETMIERARIEGKIEGIKAVKDYCFESDAIPLHRSDFNGFTESVLETLETKLKELNNEQD